MKSDIQHLTSPRHSFAAGFAGCRSCYDHLAGKAGVMITEALETAGYLCKSDKTFAVSAEGWLWFGRLQIYREDFTKIKRPLALQCTDRTERRAHLAGALGAVLLNRMMERQWFRKTGKPRILELTPLGKKELHVLLNLEI